VDDRLVPGSRPDGERMLHDPQLQGGRRGAELRPARTGARHPHPQASHKRRLAPLRAELLPAVPARGAYAAIYRHLDVTSGLPMHRPSFDCLPIERRIAWVEKRLPVSGLPRPHCPYRLTLARQPGFVVIVRYSLTGLSGGAFCPPPGEGSGRGSCSPPRDSSRTPSLFPGRMMSFTRAILRR
jgi:hypothetical protein